jgi:hypothetical protein
MPTQRDAISKVSRDLARIGILVTMAVIGPARTAYAVGEPGSAFAHAARANNPCYAWADVAEKAYDMPKGLMSAIVTQESGGHAYALNVDGKAYKYRTAEEAGYAIQDMAQRAYEIDVGCGQLNIRWHGVKFKNLGALLNPHVNMSYAAWHLSVLYKQTGSWAKAAAHYHSYDATKNRPYVCSLRRIMTQANTDAKELARFCNGDGPGLLSASR